MCTNNNNNICLSKATFGENRLSYKEQTLILLLLRTGFNQGKRAFAKQVMSSVC